MLVVGLTGNIASGKSTVARLIAERGVPLVDSDVLAREAVAPGTPALAAIVERWGTAVVAPDGALDRAALRRRVFSDPAELDALNRIVHPEVERRRRRSIETAREAGARVVLCDIPLLFEVGLDRTVDLIILVDAPREVRLARLMGSRGLDAAEAANIIDVQLAPELKRSRADFVIDNDGTLDALADRVDTAWTAVEARAGQRSS